MTCSKLSIETEEQDVKYVKYDAIGIILVSFLLTLSPIATDCFGTFIVNFEQIFQFTLVILLLTSNSFLPSWKLADIQP